DPLVTGVQTCALPISAMCARATGTEVLEDTHAFWRRLEDFGRAKPGVLSRLSVLPSRTGELLGRLPADTMFLSHLLSGVTYAFRSEERRVGKECRFLI